MGNSAKTLRFCQNPNPLTTGYISFANVRKIIPRSFETSEILIFQNRYSMTFLPFHAKPNKSILSVALIVALTGDTTGLARQWRTQGGGVRGGSTPPPEPEKIVVEK